MNGTLLASASCPADVNSTSHLRLGARGGDHYLLDGLVDEVAVYDQAISDAQITAIYAAGTAGKCEAHSGCVPNNAVAWWRFEGNAQDSIGTHHGALFGGSRTAGVAADAVEFDGVDDA